MFLVSGVYQSARVCKAMLLRKRFDCFPSCRLADCLFAACFAGLFKCVVGLVRSAITSESICASMGLFQITLRRRLSTALVVSQ